MGFPPLEFLVGPIDTLAEVVLGVPGAHRVGSQSFFDRADIEEELDALPVSFVQVVPVVVVEEEPVLQRELVWLVVLGGHVGVHDRRLPFGEPLKVLLEDTTRVQRVTWEVQEEAFPQPEHVIGAGAVHHHGVLRSDLAQEHLRVVEQGLGRHGGVLLTVAAALAFLILHHDDRCITLRQLVDRVFLGDGRPFAEHHSRGDDNGNDESNSEPNPTAGQLLPGRAREFTGRLELDLFGHREALVFQAP